MPIFIVSHNPVAIPHDEVLVPIYVGKAASAGMGVGDNTGENISDKNPNYCEMTAHYWIWKNVKDADYVGVCHYRRYFGIDLSDANICQLMKRYDVVMVEPSFYLDSVYSYFAKFIGAENMTILSTVVKERCPEYYDTLESLCDGNEFHPFNMLLCRKELFDSYAEWIFGILEACEHHIKPAPYTNAQRAIAYMAELLTPVYFLHNKYRIKSVPYIWKDGDHSELRKEGLGDKIIIGLHKALRNTLFAGMVQNERKEKFSNPAILIGLKNDGIHIS